jgi:phage/plasmid primase-like uncharacterized protein
MLTYRTGCAGAPSMAMAMAEYLAKEATAPGLAARLASYYGNGLMSDEGAAIGGIPRADMHPLIADLLGIDPSKPLTVPQMANLLAGLRADGQKIEWKKPPKKNRPNLSYADFTLSAPKSFSVAWALAPTEAERAILDKCFKEAVDETMDLIAEAIGSVSKGDTSKKNVIMEKGHVAIIQHDHFTARPTYKMRRVENGISDTELVRVEVDGDMQRHVHGIIITTGITDRGRVGAVQLQAIDGRIHEWGSVCQAILATKLRRHGVNVELDSREGLGFHERMARLTDVPQRMVDLFSQRSTDGEVVARAVAKSRGLDFDTLSPDAKVAMLKNGAQASRRAKEGGPNIESWVEQAKEAGYTHRSVLRPGEGVEPGPRNERLPKAYAISLPIIEEQFEKRAVIKGSDLRVAAAKSLIATGIQGASEVNILTSAYRSEGVTQDGKKTDIHWAFDPAERYARVTTQLSVDQEREAIDILRSAHEDKSTVLSLDAIDRAVAKVSKEGFDFSKDHGLKQRGMAEKLAASGRAAVGVGVAGSGKSTMLRILVEAWGEDRRDVYGATVAWRQTKGLRDAGIGRKVLLDSGIVRDKTFALSPFLSRLEKGELKLGPRSVVVIDEISLVGTTQVLRLARKQREQGFQIVAIGDDMQGQSIDAGATIDLCRRAFGSENVPELLSTIRQLKVRDQETSLMFRDGNAEGALARKDQDGTLFIVPGGYDDAVRGVVDLWWERREANRDTKDYSLGISVPTNADGRAIGEEIKRRRQAAGELGPDLCRINATDQNGEKYSLSLAVGDKVRLFDRVYGKDSDNRNGIVGENGTVVEVVGADKGRVIVRKPSGLVSVVEWASLLDKKSGLIRLTRGDAVTIDARQSETLTEHITAMPGGSSAVNGFKTYVAESRHRWTSWIVTSQGAEKMEVESRRPMGDPRNQSADPGTIKTAILENMARNMSDQPKKTLAVDFIDRAVNLKSGSIDSMQAAWHRAETGQEPRPQQAAERQRQRSAVEPVIKQITSNATSMDTVIGSIQDLVRDFEAERTAPVAPAQGLSEHAGWKLHLNVAPSESDRVTRDIADWLTEERIHFKISQEAGKGMTVYVGGYAKARDLADELEDRFRLPEAAAVPEDVRWSRGVNARFDAAGDREFHQWGVGGVPILLRHVQDGYGTPDGGFNIQNAQEAETILMARYGAVYGPGVLHGAAPGAGEQRAGTPVEQADPARVAPQAPLEQPASSDPPVPALAQPPRPSGAVQPDRPPMSEHEAQAAFAAELQRHGFDVKGPPIMDGLWHRAAVAGDRGAQKSGGYKGWLSPAPGGIVNNFKGGEPPVTWRPDRDMTQTAASGAQREQDRIVRLERQAAHRAHEQAGADQARSIWDGAAPAHTDHPYLRRKGIGPGSLRQAVKGQTATYRVDGKEKRIPIQGRLIVPMQDADGKLWNVQMIKADGNKLFLSGRKVGLFTTIGPKTPEDQPIVIAEGYATGATLRDTTALTAIVAFDSGNMPIVAQSVRYRQPERPIIIAADNDHTLKKNVGIIKAAEAARDVGGIAVVPPFGSGDSMGDTDWNDFSKKHGRQAARADIERQLHGMILPPMPTVTAATMDQKTRDASRSASAPVKPPQNQPVKQPQHQDDKHPTL